MFTKPRAVLDSIGKDLQKHQALLARLIEHRRIDLIEVDPHTNVHADPVISSLEDLNSEFETLIDTVFTLDVPD